MTSDNTTGAGAERLARNLPMLSFRADAALKAKYVSRAIAHREADEIVQKLGWDGSVGCCIGCLAHDYPAHGTLSRDLDVPEALFHLADAIHEGLPGSDAKVWPERFISAIPVGADLEPVRWRFLHWLLTDTAVNPGIEHETVKDAVKGAADLCLKAALGEMPSEDDWAAARAAAAAAESAAAAAAESAAAWAAESAAAAAAESAAAAAAESAAAWKLMSDRLVSFLQDAGARS